MQKLNQYNVDYLLLGVYAMDSGGIYTCSESEGAVKAKMLASARKKIAMADSSKLDTTGLIRICTLQDVDILVTDKFPEGRLLEAMQKAGVEIIVAG